MTAFDCKNPIFYTRSETSAWGAAAQGMVVHDGNKLRAAALQRSAQNAEKNPLLIPLTQRRWHLDV